MNAILCAAQGTAFDMIMSSLALMALNDIDNILALVFYVLSGINLDEMKTTSLTRRDYFFSKGFAIPHLLWVLLYSLIMLGVIPIGHPPTFINSFLYIQTFATIIAVTIWYMICYSTCLNIYSDD